MARERPPPRASHHLVDVAVEIHVARVGRGGRERSTDQGREHEPGTRQPACRQDHGRHGRDQQQDDDARLGQRREGTHRVPERAIRRRGEPLVLALGAEVVARRFPSGGDREGNDGCPDQGGDRDVGGTRPRRELRDHVERADGDLCEHEHECERRQTDEP